MQLPNKYNFKKGFSLMELLVGIAILGIVSVITVNLFLTNLSNKSKMEAQMIVKQNGNQVLQVISTLIRNAQSVSCTSSSTTITSPDGGTTTFSCNSISCPTRIASNSACLTTSSLNLPSCSFTCDTSSSSKPTTVKVQFTLSKGSTTDIKTYSSQNFSTTISLRKY